MWKMSIIISIFPWKHSWLMLLIISLFIRTLAAVPLVSGGRVLFCFLDWKWPPLLVQQQVNQFSRWAPDLFSKSPFVYFWLRVFCPRLLICVKKKKRSRLRYICCFRWRGETLAATTTQVLLLPPRRPHSSIAMCCLSKLRFWAGLSHRWLATAPATCIVALCKSAHTGTEARGGGILSSVAGVENGGRGQ